MILSRYDLTLDVLQPNPQYSITAWLGDTGRQIRFRLRQGARPYPLEPGITAVFTAKRPDGTVLLHPCTVAEDALLYDFTPQTAALPGRLACQLRLYRGELLLTAPRFELVVEDTVCHEGDIPAPETELSAFHSLIREAHTLKDALEELLTLSDPHPQGIELAGAYLEKKGYPQTVGSAIYKLDRYRLLAGRTYRLQGRGASLRQDYPMAVFCLSAAMGDTNIGTLLISGGTDTPRDYDLTFVPETDGYLFVAKCDGHVSLTVNGSVCSVNGRTGAVSLTAADVNAYTKAETEALLNTFSFNHDTYTKAEIDQILLTILPPPLPTYTKDEVDALLANYALKAQVDAALGAYITDVAALIGGDA